METKALKAKTTATVETEIPFRKGVNCMSDPCEHGKHDDNASVHTILSIVTINPHSPLPQHIVDAADTRR